MVILHTQPSAFLLHNSRFLDPLLHLTRRSALPSCHHRPGIQKCWIPHQSEKWRWLSHPKLFAVCFNGKRTSDFRPFNASDAVVAAIYQLEFLVREPADVLDRMRDHLSTRDLQLVLLYFSQEGRDSWCALEVFEWMQKVNKVENETHDLMMSIMFRWVMDLVERGGSVTDVKGLLRDMICVGLQPESDIVQAIICGYLDRGKKEEAMKFVLDISESEDIVGEGPDNALPFLILKMAGSHDGRDAMKLVAHLGNRNSKVPFHVYNAALLAVVSEQQELTRVLRDLRSYQERNEVGELEGTERSAIQAYQKGLHDDGEQIACWALEQQQGREAVASIHQKLLAMYCVAGNGLEAEGVLWRMKLAGCNISAKLYNIVVGICAYNNHQDTVRHIINTMKADGPIPDQKTYSALFGGFVKGGHPEEAIHAFLDMLDQGFRPDKKDVLAVMKQIPNVSNLTLVFKLGQRLVQAALIEPFFVYLHIDRLKLSILITL